MPTAATRRTAPARARPASSRPPADARGEAATHAWAVFLRAHRRLVDAVEADLAHAGLPPLAWYDVLWELEKADAGRLRLAALAERIVLSRSNLTRLADRLEQAGLIAREACADDRRGAFAVLTDAGRRQRRAMWTVYAKSIERHWSSGLSTSEATAIARALGRLASEASTTAER